jgi:Na+-transporting NADH:ubiquinone oxidoreductase subunit NqrF
MSEDIRKMIDKVKNFKKTVNESENYNKIIEELPIKVDVEKSWTGHYYTINVPPMKMKYETYLKLGDNLSDDQIKYGKERDGRVYSKDIETLSNDVSVSHYDYKNGEASFKASTENDVRNWLELYKEYVYSDNF